MSATLPRHGFIDRDGSAFTEYDDFGVEYRDASHRYHLWRDGERTDAVSVTSALGVLDKGQGLLRWAEACGAEGAAILARQGELDDVPAEEAIDRVRLFKLGMEAKRDAGAGRGTIVHSVLEAWSLDGTVPNVADFETVHRGYVQGLCRWLLKTDPTPIAVERVVASPLHRFAGRADLVAEINGLPMLVDLKTSPRARIFDQAHAQTAGYQLALAECGIDVTAAVVVVVGEDGAFIEEACCAGPELFLSVLAAYRGMARLRSDRRAVA